MPDAPRPGASWLAPAVVAGVAGGSLALYRTAPPAVADVAIFPYGLSLVLGPAWVYPWLRRRGAGVARAAAAALLVPALWLVKEAVAVAAVYDLASTLFYTLNPLAAGLLVGAALQMAVAELCLRRLRDGRWQLANGAGLVVAGVALLATAFTLAARAHGITFIFYGYVALYRRLFGG